MLQSLGARPRSLIGKRQDSNQSAKESSARKEPAAKSSQASSKRSKGRNFENFSSLPVPHVGGVLGQHWRAWQSLRK